MIRHQRIRTNTGVHGAVGAAALPESEVVSLRSSLPGNNPGEHGEVAAFILVVRLERGNDNHLDPFEHIVEHADGLELPLGDEQHPLLGGDAVRDLLLLRARLLQLPAALLNLGEKFNNMD